MTSAIDTIERMWFQERSSGLHPTTKEIETVIAKARAELGNKETSPSLGIIRHYYDPHAWICADCGHVSQDVNLGLSLAGAVLCPICRSPSVAPQATSIIISLEEEVDRLKTELNKRT
jgi:rubrerythrin